jgi:hypothetical protein
VLQRGTGAVGYHLAAAASIRGSERLISTVATKSHKADNWA